MKKKLRALLLTLLAFFTAASAAACAGEEIVAEGDTTVAATLEEPEYVYPELDCGGNTISILNSDAIWSMYVYLDHEVQTGDVLDDEVYLRNRRVEERYNCRLAVTTGGSFDALLNTAVNSIISDDDEFAMMYLPLSSRPSLLTENYLTDLSMISSLHLNEKWWDQATVESFRIGESIYFATSDLHLMAFDSSWCLFFNEGMMTDLNLDRPYDMVRAGDWTLDRLRDYTKAAANINGDDSFAWNQNGAAVYGISAHEFAMGKLLYASGERFAAKDEDGFPVFAADHARFYDVTEKLASLGGSQGEYFNGYHDDFNPSMGGYIYVFSAGRALFLTAELKTSLRLRDAEVNFGIVPMPKYDDVQEEYYTTVVSPLLVFTIPVTNRNMEQTGIIADTLSYESYKTVLPVYYDLTVSQKGLRNEDSIEMLDYLRTTRGVDIATVFGWTSALEETIRGRLSTGNSAIASLIAASKQEIEISIANTVALFRGLA